MTEKCQTDYFGVSDEQVEICFKTMRAVQPDVTIVVGGVEFRHYSTFLCCNSDYFDAMLSVDMKEKSERRIEFAEKDPEEWKVFYAFIDPRSCNNVKLNNDNVDMLLPWFHEFAMEEKLVECDTVLSRRITTMETMNYTAFSRSVVTATMFDLARTSELAEYRILKAIEVSMSNDEKWNKAAIKALTPAWVAKGELWDRFVSFRMFPDEWLGKSQQERRHISDSPMFDNVILTMYELIVARNEIHELSQANLALEKRTVQLDSKNEVRLGLECYIRSLHHGAFFGRKKMVPVDVLQNIYNINEGYLHAAGIEGPNWGWG